MRQHLLPAALFALLLSAGLSTHAAELRVTVHGVPSDAATVRLALFDHESRFLQTPAQAIEVGAHTRNSNGSVSLVFPQVAPGRYALSAFHDLNDNGVLDRNAMGLPAEPLGFSNGARVRFGPPKFDAAAITVEATDLAIELTLR